MAYERKRRGRPATGETPKRTIRVPEHLWARVLARTAAEHTTVAQVVNAALEAYVSEPAETR